MTQENISQNNAPNGENGSASPPYISFSMFNNNFLPWIETEGIPLKFDRSFWGKKFSGSGGLQLMASLRFLGLLKGDTPQSRLENIVKAKAEERKPLLAEMIRQAYAKVDFQQLDRATPSMVNEWISGYGIDRTTLRKASSFFINACKAYDIPLSNSLKKMARNKPTKTGASRPLPRKIEPGDKSEPENTLRKPATQNNDSGLSWGVQKGQIYRIKLNSAGEITLVVDLPIFDISSEDREFALKLVDAIKGYAVSK